MSKSARTVLVAVVAISAWGLLTTSAGAAVIAPTVFTDDITVNGNCTLREAIQATNLNATVDGCVHTGAAEPDTINLAGGTPYELTVDGAAENLNQTGDLDPDLTGGGGNLTIDGAGTTATTINAETGWADRILQRTGGNTLTVSDLTITDGNESLADPGGGIHSLAGALVVERVRVTANSSSLRGGGIAAFGTALSVTDSTIDNNTSTGSPGAGGLYSITTTTTVTRTLIRDNTATNSLVPEGGGMKVEGTTLTITDSVIDDNHVIDTDPNGAVFAGGLQILGASTTIRNSTVSNNDITGASTQIGGGIHTTGNLTLINSTVSGNAAPGVTADGGGLAANGGTTNVIHSTFGPNLVGDQGSAIFNNAGAGNMIVRGSVIETSGVSGACGGTAITSMDDNVFTDLTCGPEAGNDDADADPMLGALLDNGGTDAGAPGSLEGFPTHAPAMASTVVDHVPAADCDNELAAPLLVDQRGFVRPLDSDDAGTVADCEAGSVEIAATPPPPVVVTPPVTPAPTTPAKKKKKCKKKKGKKGAGAAKKKKCKK